MGLAERPQEAHPPKVKLCTWEGMSVGDNAHRPLGSGAGIDGRGVLSVIIRVFWVDLRL